VAQVLGRCVGEGGAKRNPRITGALEWAVKDSNLQPWD
jgi:hypothetical protein